MADDASRDARVAPPAPPAERAGGHETILLVEDDQNLRTVVARMLERFGFTVLTATNGRQALAICDTHAATIDLLITDVIMPELGGPELVEHLAERGVFLRVLYMSGYSDQALLRRIAFSPTTQLLRKPFTLDALLKAVREILDG
jgi:two-component system cell cycle sensor histidine kinase/response regulator CckA